FTLASAATPDVDALGGELCRGRAQVDELAQPQNAEAHRAPDGLVQHEPLQIAGIRDRVAVDLEDQVASPQPRGGRRTAGYHLFDADARGMTKAACDPRREWPPRTGDAQPGAADPAG